jgi:predicted fused transcriptional regulator/phosphomethylpyrimidine kinase
MTKKPYTKPSVSKIEVDSDVIRMLTKQGFADLFWERLQEAKRVDEKTTQECVFNMLNEKYEKAIGCTRYSCFDSFRIVRDKK